MSSRSGKMATVHAEVCMRPCDSVAGTRCTRCVPLSNFNREKTPEPATRAITSLKPPCSPSLALRISTSQPRASA